ncbi:glucosaminyltransferase [Methanosarcina sp. A14]|uniref:Putative glycosyltransferase n=1 Tax=Methanosarcina barkeri MS TaxID=1434108 RepID=A0A0E3LMW7_METBA|nr:MULTISPECIES: glycosyltransferase family 2 protein [Methanosarcina]AKB53741.1 putative glycosyltransferase [Methanosarcina barkeri MS]OED04580.1 glucosaminyltransferase [Methanosarcina sp. A14]
MEPLLLFFYIIGFTCFSVGILTIPYYPLSLAFEMRKSKQHIFSSENPFVSIVVPAYNEGKVIGHCIESILASNYSEYEVILVDDGSSDNTLEEMQRYETNSHVIVVTKKNGGKASALNVGLNLAKGEVLFFVDADGIFAPDTISKMLSGFISEDVGAVCGNDAPINLDKLQTQLANLLTHVGTGFVRRALSTIDCLPVVSGNIGAYRSSTLEKTGPFLEGFIGEDMELTWRVHKAGYKIVFQPWAIVYAEAPSTITGLWKQRVRWARGLLKTAYIHRDMLFNPKYGLFAFYLPINLTSMIIIPLLQLISIILLPILLLRNINPIPLNWIGIMGWLGMFSSIFALLFSIALDRAWLDLKYFYVIPLWVLYSFMMDVVMLWAIIVELRREEANWNKLDRTGIVSR